MSNARREAVYLYVAQFSNMVLPFILIPYLTSVLGVAYYGKLSFSQTVSVICLFFVDFGFNLSAAKRLGASLADGSDKNIIFTNVQVVKLLIYILIIICSIIIFCAYPAGNIDRYLILVGAVSSISSILSMGWFFQGVGKNSYVAFSSLFARLASLILMILLVKGPDDIVEAAILQLSSPVIAGVITTLIVMRKGMVKFDMSLLSIRSCTDVALDSFHNFSASFVTLGFTYFNPILIKFFLGDVALGIYSLADKLVTVLRQLYAPMIQANFSEICQMFAAGEASEVLRRNLKVAQIFTLISVGSFCGNALVGLYVLQRFIGKGYSAAQVESVHAVLYVMIITQFIISISMILVNLTIIPSGNSRHLKYVYTFALAIYIIIIYPMIHVFKIYGVAWAICIVESAIVWMFLFFVRRQRILS